MIAIFVGYLLLTPPPKVQAPSALSREGSKEPSSPTPSA